MNKEQSPLETTNLLPNVCSTPTILASMVLGFALSITLTISKNWNEHSITYFVYSSIFIQWIILSNIGVLCWGRNWFNRHPPEKASLIAFITFQVITLLVSELGYQILTFVSAQFAQERLFHLRLVTSNLMISCIISMIVLKVFQLQRYGIIRTNAINSAKIDALQARIRPHFFFNSMNTIAELVHEQPDAAENAVIDLSELFRSSLGKHEFISLQDEINITKRYTNIEKLRLGNRLTINWQLPTPLPDIMLPALLIQPLVENAIYHGIEPLPSGGVIDVILQAHHNNVTIKIHNPVVVRFTATHAGNQTAVSNIQQRLELIYDGKASMSVEKTDTCYAVNMVLPQSE